MIFKYQLTKLCDKKRPSPFNFADPFNFDKERPDPFNLFFDLFDPFDLLTRFVIGLPHLLLCR